MSLNINKSATVSEALDTRITVRQFLDTPVSDDQLRAVLSKAMRSPSGGNLQPWKIHVMTGDTLANFKKDAAYPSPLWEPQRSWRYKLGEDMYGLIGIPRENKMGRLVWLAQNAKFFDAPVGLIITGDKRLGAPQHMDVGILLQSIMLLARETGLHTAPQGWWRNWTSVCHKYLDIPEEEEVLVGMAIGYGDPDAKVNNLYADRADLDEVTTFYT